MYETHKSKKNIENCIEAIYNGWLVGCFFFGMSTLLGYLMH